MALISFAVFSGRMFLLLSVFLTFLPILLAKSSPHRMRLYIFILAQRCIDAEKLLKIPS